MSKTSEKGYRFSHWCLTASMVLVLAIIGLQQQQITELKSAVESTYQAEK